MKKEKKPEVLQPIENVLNNQVEFREASRLGMNFSFYNQERNQQRLEEQEGTHLESKISEIYKTQAINNDYHL